MRSLGTTEVFHPWADVCSITETHSIGMVTDQFTVTRSNSVMGRNGSLNGSMMIVPPRSYSGIPRWRLSLLPIEPICRFKACHLPTSNRPETQAPTVRAFPMS